MSLDMDVSVRALSETKPHKGLKVARKYTVEGIDPFSMCQYETRTSRITDTKGNVVFEADEVEVPTFWSQLATDILASKYFRKRGVTADGGGETSIRQVIVRIVRTIEDHGWENGYFATEADRNAFGDELTYMLLHQYGAFNSPVWFNVGLYHAYGIKGNGGHYRYNSQAQTVESVPHSYQYPQASACFILGVEDTLDSIYDLVKTEVRLFKHGSGTGSAFDKIRGKGERLSGGGASSGVMSWLKVLDAAAGSIKSGGTTRRAATMRILSMEHPEIVDFIEWKSREEKKARALIAAGYPADFNGEVYQTISGQNSNNSVRVSDKFMRTVEADGDWTTTYRTTGEAAAIYKARDLWRKIAEAAWECADPGIQYDTTINDWNPCKTSGRVEATNPCSEYSFLTDTACNLASLNLTKFLREGSQGMLELDVDGFRHAVRVFFTAQEILVGLSSYPTAKVAENSHKFRPLGLGYCNLGTLLMTLGLPYDSDVGRAVASCITAIMHCHAGRVSAEMAAELSPFEGFEINRVPMLDVMRKHREAALAISQEHAPAYLRSAAIEDAAGMVTAGEKYGYRNAQFTVTAPTGCLVAGSLVATDRGLVRIETLGDTDGPQWQDIDVSVQTNEGPQKATKFYVNGVDDVIEVETCKGFRLRGTPKHQIKIIASDGSWTWRRFDALEPGDRVPVAMNQLLGSPCKIELPPCPPTYRTNYKRGFRAPVELNAALAELVGIFAANGSSHTKGLRFAMYGADKDATERYAGFLRDLFGVEPKPRLEGEYTSLDINSTQLRDWWAASGFAKTAGIRKGKGFTVRVPDAVLASNDPKIYGAYLRGLFTGDGSVTSGAPSVTNKDRAFILDVQTLLLALGVPMHLDEQRGGWSGRPVWRLTCTSRIFNAAFTASVGFAAKRKQDLVQFAGTWSNADYIPLSAADADRICPVGAERRALVTQHRYEHAGIPRHLAIQFFEETGDAALGKALSFYYDSVAATTLVGREPTYDLSVPSNVTYYANGFVSHNTIGLLMDCDTTGVEPDFALVKYKKLAGGGNVTIINASVKRALGRLGYTAAQVNEILAYALGSDTSPGHGTLEGAPYLKSEHLAVFDCANRCGDGTRFIEPVAHLKMMAAAQPFLSGAQSKTCNVPNEATVEQIQDLYYQSWKLGLKCVAVYRDGCKASQPLSTKAEVTEPRATPEDMTLERAKLVVEQLRSKFGAELFPEPAPYRKRLPKRRHGMTQEAVIGGIKLFLRTGEYDDGSVGEIFLDMHKEGAAFRAMANAFAISISMGLQYGVPLDAFVEQFIFTRFEPHGPVQGDEHIKNATSILDYVFRTIGVNYLQRDDLAHVKPDRDTLSSASIRPVMRVAAEVLATEPHVASFVASAEKSGAPFCDYCGHLTVRNGTCWRCLQCGGSLGCS